MSALRKKQFRHGLLSDIRVVPRFGSHSSLTCYPLRTPWRDRNRLFRACGSDLGLRHVMSGSALLTVLQSASPRADFSGLPGSPLQRPVKLLTPVQICPSNKIQNERRFRSPRGHRRLDCAREIFAGHNTKSSFLINAVDCEGHLKGLGNHLPNIRQDAGLAVAASPCRASARAESCPKWFWAVRKIRCVGCACKG